MQVDDACQYERAVMYISSLFYPLHGILRRAYGAASIALWIVLAPPFSDHQSIPILLLSPVVRMSVSEDSVTSKSFIRKGRTIIDLCIYTLVVSSLDFLGWYHTYNESLSLSL